MIVYRTNKYDLAEVVALEASKKTAKCVWLIDGGGRREKRSGQWNRYFDSWDEVRDFMLGRADQAIRKAEDEFKDATKAYVAIEKMKPPRVKRTAR
jgi:hypothetical protein